MQTRECERARGEPTTLHICSLPYIHTHTHISVAMLPLGFFAFSKFTFVCMCSSSERANIEKKTEKKMTSRLSIAERRVDVAPSPFPLHSWATTHAYKNVLVSLLSHVSETHSMLNALSHSRALSLAYSLTLSVLSLLPFGVRLLCLLFLLVFSCAHVNEFAQ